MTGKSDAVKRNLTGIRWKIVFIYFLLVFIATTIIGVFIMSQLEAYYNNSISTNLKNTVNEGTLLTSLEEFESLEEHAEEIQNNVDAWSKSIQEIFVVDDRLIIIAATNEYKGKNAHGILEETLISQAFGGATVEYDSSYSLQDKKIPTKNIAFPIENHQGEITGVLYLRADMSDAYETINQSKLIFVRAMAVGLAITVILGFLISRSITVPINEVTEKAAQMVRGDFSQEVPVRSDDEIGQLAMMLNELRQQLTETLEEISNEKNKLETILRYMADGLIAVDLDGNIMHANPAAMEMLRFTDEDVATKHYDEVIAKYSDTLLLAEINRKCETEGVSETFIYGGATFAIRYGRFKNENSQDRGIIMILQDITEQQKLENMQTDFVANVSHELKTPLTTIKSYTETLLEGGADDPDILRQFLDIINMEADRMNRLVKELLQLSRLEYKQEKWYKKEGNIITLLKSAVTKVDLTARSKSQHLNCIFDDDALLLIDMDRDRIEQVVLNVLSNAMNYTPERGRIDIDAVQRGKTVQIIIADNGIGIPQEELSRVFERFFRVDKARSRSAGGTGLGLAISKQIVEEHKGSIEIESKEGKGTKVTIILPTAPIRGKQNID